MFCACRKRTSVLSVMLVKSHLSNFNLFRILEPFEMQLPVFEEVPPPGLTHLHENKARWTDSCFTFQLDLILRGYMWNI